MDTPDAQVGLIIRPLLYPRVCAEKVMLVVVPALSWVEVATCGAIQPSCHAFAGLKQP